MSNCCIVRICENDSCSHIFSAIYFNPLKGYVVAYLRVSFLSVFKNITETNNRLHYYERNN